MIGQEKLQKFKAEFGSRNCSKGGVHRDCCGSEDSKFLERNQIGDCRCSHTETADLIPSAPWKKTPQSVNVMRWAWTRENVSTIYCKKSSSLQMLSSYLHRASYPSLRAYSYVSCDVAMALAFIFDKNSVHVILNCHITRATGLNLQLPVKLTSIIFLGKQTPYCHKFIINCKN